jgi:hypothetical protein
VIRSFNSLLELANFATELIVPDNDLLLDAKQQLVLCQSLPRVVKLGGRFLELSS